MHRDAEPAAHGAVGTVGADQITGAYDPRAAARDVSEHDAYSVRVAVPVDHLGPELHAQHPSASRWLSRTDSV